MSDAEALAARAAEFLDEGGFSYEISSEGNAINTWWVGMSCHLRVLVRCREFPVTFVEVVVLLPDVVPEARRAQAAETVVRASYGLSIGSFQLDMSDGELSFHASLPIADGTFTQDQFFNLVFVCVAAADLYHRAFARLIHGDELSPAEVIAEIEMATD